MLERAQCEFTNIPIYIDPYMKVDEILVGHKEGDGKKNFIIIHPETQKLLFSEERINDERYEKLKRILDELND